jgi:hypothetical protein
MIKRRHIVRLPVCGNLGRVSRSGRAARYNRSFADLQDYTEPPMAESLRSRSREGRRRVGENARSRSAGSRPRVQDARRFYLISKETDARSFSAQTPIGAPFPIPYGLVRVDLLEYSSMYNIFYTYQINVRALHINILMI